MPEVCRISACRHLALRLSLIAGFLLPGLVWAEHTLAEAAKNVSQIVAHRGSSTDRPENTAAAYQRAIEAGATAIEIDLRTTKDGHLVSLHDADLQRTTNGSGALQEKTLREVRQFDAGSWFDPRFKGERVPTFREILDLARGKIDVLIDLKEKGAAYAEKIVSEIREHGEPQRIILGIRTVEHAKLFRKLLPEARQLGLIPDQDSIEAFAAAGVGTIRIWPKWLAEGDLASRVKKSGAKLHLNGTAGTRKDTEPLLEHRPDSMSSDDPGRLRQTLAEIAAGR